MQKMRSLSVALFAIVAAAACAQSNISGSGAAAVFDGPAPLAWRWLPTSGEAATGSPTLNGDTIYVACGGRIYALDRTTGNRMWQFPAEDPIAGKFRYAPIMANGVLVATGDNKIVYGIDANTGAPKWSFVLPDGPTGQPILVDKTVVQALSSSRLVAIDPTTGQTIWKSASGDLQTYLISDRISGQIVASGDSVLYFTQRNDLHNVDVITRTEDAWARPIRFAAVDASIQPLVYNGAVYVGSGQFLASINPETGVLNWQVPTGFQAAFTPAASSQGIFVVSNDGQAMLFDPSNNGSPTAGMPKPIALGSSPATQPSAIGDKFIVPTASGALDMIDPSTGSIIWSYVIRPVGKLYESQSKSGANGKGGGFGGPVGGQGGGPGGQGGPGGPAGQGGSTNSNKEITEIEASGPAELDGTTLLVPARDSSLLAFDKTLGVDLTPPTVQLLFPNPGDQVAGLPPLLLYFKIRDEGSGVNEKTIQIKIDDKTYDFKYERSGYVTVQFSREGKNRLLADGRHVITVNATDWLGNVANQSFSLTIDNTLPPVKLPGQPTTRPPGAGGRGGAGGFGKGGGGGD
jgi:outer membrane protein assembly factor BamB